MEANEPTTSAPRVVKRRTLVKGAAWSVPVVATGFATPAFAQSVTPPEPGDICKETGLEYRVYVNSAAIIGTTIVYTFQLNSTEIFFSGDNVDNSGSGIVFRLCGLTATSLTFDFATLTYTLTATVTNAESYPFVVIENVNIDSSGNRYIDITEAGVFLVRFQTNFTNCSPRWNKSPFTCNLGSNSIEIPEPAAAAEPEQQSTTEEQPEPATVESEPQSATGEQQAPVEQPKQESILEPAPEAELPEVIGEDY